MSNLKFIFALYRQVPKNKKYEWLIDADKVMDTLIRHVKKQRSIVGLINKSDINKPEYSDILNKLYYNKNWIRVELSILNRDGTYKKDKILAKVEIK